jgi:hypothetical protein
VVFSDGSEDGIDTLGAVAALFDAAADIQITLAAVTWPERRSPIWDRAHEYQPMAWGDLHAAVALIVTRVLEEARIALGPLGLGCDSIVTIGEPAAELVRLLDEQQADLAFVAVTAGAKRDDVLSWVSVLTAQARCPVVVMHAPMAG